MDTTMTVISGDCHWCSEELLRVTCSPRPGSDTLPKLMYLNALLCPSHCPPPPAFLPFFSFLPFLPFSCFFQGTPRFGWDAFQILRSEKDDFLKWVNSPLCCIFLPQRLGNCAERCLGKEVWEVSEEASSGFRMKVGQELSQQRLVQQILGSCLCAEDEPSASQRAWPSAMVWELPDPSFLSGHSRRWFHFIKFKFAMTFMSHQRGHTLGKEGACFHTQFPKEKGLFLLCEHLPKFPF